MHNNIMAVGSRDHPPMLVTGRYKQWRPCFLRYIDTRPNGDALRKCILKGPYTPSTIIILAVPAMDNSPAVPERTTVETVLNMSPQNKAHFESEKEAIHLILTRIGDEIYSTVDACKTTHEMWEAIERLQEGESLNIQDVKTNLFWEFGKFTSYDGESMESYYSRFYKLMNEMIINNLIVATMQVNVQFLQQLQPEWSRFVTIVKQQHKLDEVSYHKIFDILKQYQKEVNEIRAERIAKNAYPLALVATAQPHQDPYYQTSKSHKSYAPTSKTSLTTISHATTRHKVKEIAKPITPSSESASKEDSDHEQAQKDKEIQKNLALIANSELRIHDHSNESSSLKLVPKVVPPADKIGTSRQELELLFYHYIIMLRLYGGGGIPFQPKLDSIPHAHAQTTKTYYKHQDTRIKKVQDSKTKTSTNSDIQDLPSRYQVYQERLLASFLDDANEEISRYRQLLTSLPASHEHFVDTLLYGREALTLEDVMATLNSKEIKERSKVKGDDGEGLYVRGRSNRRDSRQSRGKSKSKSRGKRLKCYICQFEDHLKRNCPKNNRKKSTGYVKKDEQPSFSGLTYDDSEVMSAQDLLDWIMDSGCSYHMTPRLDILFDFLECDGGSVQLGDNMECKIRGIGKVRIQLKDGSSFMLHNVRYIPELKRNLISLGTLEKEGYTVKLQSGKVKVINGSRVILFRIRRDNCVYSLDGHAIAGELNASVEEKDCLAFDVERHTTQGVIDYVHSDLCGPSQVESLGGKRYFLSIVDDYSRRVWVYTLRFKHEAFGKFKEWKQLVENQTGGTVKKLMTDNGLEFCNQKFKQLCIKSGIARHLTVAGTPQQNGVAECMNRTLMDKVRCLLIQSGLPKSFWAEATCKAAYLINRSPSIAIEKKTPMKMWSGHPSYYEILRIFGCVAYPHDKQGKLEPRAIKYVLLGYPEGLKGYRLYRIDDESPKIVTSRNVVFNESVMYKDTLKDSGTGVDKSVEELQVEVVLQRLNNHTLEEDQTDQEDSDDEDAGDQETDQTPDLTDY
ncbi:retrotransposon protein, putative, ty1-copia subclass [Tanacetum coccineum]